jgi:hypothetical protein
LGGDVANQYTSTFSFESEEDKQILLNLIGNPKIENRIATRARILLLREEGKRQIEVGELLKVHRNTVRLWEKRYKKKGVKGLYDRPGRGRHPTFSP